MIYHPITIKMKESGNYVQNGVNHGYEKGQIFSGLTDNMTPRNMALMVMMKRAEICHG